MSPKVCVYEKFRRLPYYFKRRGEICVKEKVQPLKIINALFLEPHTRCYMMFIFSSLI